MENIKKYLAEQHKRFESDLFEWLRIPSIGTDPAYASQTRDAANWIADKFRALGLATEFIEPGGHPIVYAESPPVAGKPTVLVYGHYDVQPPDPWDLWETPPFEPSIRGGKVFARGATDDKGQMITHLFGAEALLKTTGQLPLQVKFLIEGEEESGGGGIKKLLQGELDTPAFHMADKLDADIAVISDCSQFAPGQPAITHGLRGNIYFQVKLIGPDRDLHSGKFGGTLANPINALCNILAKMQSNDGRILLPGFYDSVREPTADEKAALEALDFSETEYRDDLGVDELTGEPGYTTLERRWCRPTFDVHGLWGGYEGKGAKTVLPSVAQGKFSCRMVPDQTPEEIREIVESHFKKHCPPGIKFTLTSSPGSNGFVLPIDNPFMKAAARAISKGFGKEPVYIRSGGSIPIVNQLKTKLGIDTLLLGWGQDDDDLHSPNEKFTLADFHRGIEASAALWIELAAT